MSKRLALIGILLLATGLRFYKLDDQSFWNDEGNSARLSERSVRLIIEGTASDIHPPLYYLILRGWRELAGEHEFGLRSFSALIGVSTIAFTFALASAVTGRKKWRVALIASLVATLNPALVYYSQETRMYALMAMLAVLSTLFLLKWLFAGNRRWVAVAYVLLATAGLYTHYFFPAVILVHSLIIFGRLLDLLIERESNVSKEAEDSSGTHSWRVQSIRLARQWLLMLLAVFMLYSPWLPVFWRQAVGREGAKTSLGTFVEDFGHWMVFGHSIEPGLVLLPAVAAGILVGLGMLRAGKRSLVPVASITIPALLMFATGTTGPEFRKFILLAVPFFAILVGFVWLPIAKPRRWLLLLPVLPLLLMLWGSGRSLRNMYFDPAYERADYRGLAARIEADDHGNAGVILSAPNQWEVFTYYHRNGAPVYPLPLGPANRVEISAELERIARQHERLYAIFWGELQQDPEGLVEQWLDEHAFRAAEEWVGDVRFVTYATASGQTDQMGTRLDLRFGQELELDGFSLPLDRVQAGDIVQVTLFWQAQEPVGQRYKVFLHLIDEQGRILAQQDGEPAGGSAPTDQWRPGVIVKDQHGVLLPGDIPPGEYSLILGLYDLLDPTNRLPISTPQGVVDSVKLAMIAVW